MVPKNVFTSTNQGISVHDCKKEKPVATVLGCEGTGSDNASDKIVACRNNARMKL